MKSRLFSPGRVALVVNSLLFTPPALAACAQACKPVPLRRRAACCSTLAGCVFACRRALLRRRADCCPNSLLRSRLRPCQTKKSIDFIWHVITWDWYERARCIAGVFRRAKEKTRNRHRCGLPLSSRSPAHRHGFCDRMMNANAPPVYMQRSIYVRQEKARCHMSSGLKSTPLGMEETGTSYRQLAEM